MNESESKQLDVLLIDTDAVFAQSLADELEAADDVAVRVTTDVNAAVDAVEDATSSIACVVSGLPTTADPPAVDADSFLAAIRRVRPMLPVVQLLGRTAADSTAAAAERAFAAGATDVTYWSETSQPAALLARIRDAVTRPRSDRLLVAALDALDDVFYVYDAELGLVRWNQQLNDAFDLSDEELAGMSPTDFFVAEDVPGVERAVAEALEHGETVVEARAETPAGTRVFELTGIRLTDADGTVVGLCGVGRDHTEKRRREWQLARQNERLEEFARVVSHDLRNPLSVSKGYLDLVSEECDSDHIERIDTALSRMDRIIDDVLAAARDGRTVEDPTPVDLEAVATAAWESVATANATLRVEPATVAADTDRLQRLLENLFRNAVEHGPTGNRSASQPGDADRPESALTVTVGPTPGGFFVEDDGVGIATRRRDRVFDPGVTSSDEGTGFGLSIVRTLAEAHGWQVRLTESSTGGARFEFVSSKTDPRDR